MKMIKSAVLTMVLALFLTGPVLGAAAPMVQTACPVLSGKINRDIYVDYKGERIYFCCKGCDVEFKKDPEKYMKKMREQGVKFEKAPAAK